jgi:hypothetical protein
VADDTSKEPRPWRKLLRVEHEEPVRLGGKPSAYEWALKGAALVNTDAFKDIFKHEPECPRASLPPCTCHKS